jgi:hypothetical protein
LIFRRELRFIKSAKKLVKSRLSEFFDSLL